MFNKDRISQPPIAIYMIATTGSHLDRINCIYCPRPIAELTGTIDKMINAPAPSNKAIVVRIRCKLCKQNYDITSSDQDIVQR